jgi:hypothetical protein
VVNSILFILKRSLKDRNISVKLTASAHMFTVLGEFSKIRNPSAPVLYKALVFSAVENIDDLTVREFYL